MPRDRSVITRDVHDMRERLDKDRSADTSWDLKLARGALLDIEFLTQWLQLVTPDVKWSDRSPSAVLESEAAAETFGREDRAVLADAFRLQSDLMGLRRAGLKGLIDPDTAPAPFLARLAKAAKKDDFDAAAKAVSKAQANVKRIYEKIIAGPATE